MSLIRLKPNSKEPLDNWRDKGATITAEVANEYSRLDGNLGYRIENDVVVVDGDGKYGFMESMLAAVGLTAEILARHPKAQTPNGFHYYGRKPASFQTETHLPDIFPQQLDTIFGDKTGHPVEFLSEGRYVVQPPSKIPDGEYRWIRQPDGELPQWSPEFLDRIARKQRTAASTADPGAWSEAKVRAFLSQLDPLRFASDEAWRQLAMGIHFVTNGAGWAWDVFNKWSQGDERYRNHERINLTRWESFKIDRPNSITEGTLLHIAIEHNVKLERDSEEVQTDFAGITNEPAELSRVKANDVIFLPSPFTTFPESAKSIIERFTNTRQFFYRSTIVELGPDGMLHAVNPAALRSRIDGCGAKVMTKISVKGDVVWKPARCSEADAKGILNTVEVRELPPIRLVSLCAVIIAGEDGSIAILGPGYHSQNGGILVTGKREPVRIELNEAAAALLELLADFDFASGGDRSRAIAMLLTPALVMGGWFRGFKTPIQCAEADHSQSGKTLLMKIVHAIYGERPYFVTKKTGGVGSFDELISSAYMSGKPFIVVDNTRGSLDSAFLEAAITTPDAVAVRVPHMATILLDCSAATVQLTSNGIQATRDLANRCIIVRIRKRPSDYIFKRREEELLGHIATNQGYYLGCIFAVVEAWAKAGRPTLGGKRLHDFREWTEILNWIVQELFGLSALMDGHESAQMRISDPALGWLRAVCIAAKAAGLFGQELTASGILDLCERDNIDLPGLRMNADDQQARQHAGKLLARCFRGRPDQVISIDGFEVVRREIQVYDPVFRHTEPVKKYVIDEELCI